MVQSLRKDLIKTSVHRPLTFNVEIVKYVFTSRTDGRNRKDWDHFRSLKVIFCIYLNGISISTILKFNEFED